MAALAVKVKPGHCKPNVGGQADFLRCWDAFYQGLEGGWGSGKTWAGALKLLTAHVMNAIDDAGRMTGCPSAVLAPTYRNLKDFDLPALRDGCKALNISYRWNGTESILTLPDFGTREEPSIIRLRSAENPEAITGWEAGVGWGDEPTRWPEDWTDPKKDAFLQFTGRIRHPAARWRGCFLTYTNEGDATRMYEWFHCGGLDRKLFRAKTKDNPLVREFYERQAASMSAEMAKQYLDGDAMSLRGAKCYPVFDSDKHVKAAAAISAGVRVALALDFNIAPGMHALLGQYLLGHDIFVVAHEFFRPRLSVRDLVPMVVWELVRLGVKSIDIYGDSAGNAKNPSNGESCYDTLLKGLVEAKIGWELHVPADSPFQVDRINATNMALMDLQGNRHVLIHPSCDRLITDLTKVKFDEKGKIDKKNPDLTHASDAFGYWVHYVRPVRVELPTTLDRFSVSVR